MKSEKDELKPCPFCGGTPKLLQIGNAFTKSRSTKIKCGTFGCTVNITVGAIQQSHQWTAEKAIEKWNTRVESGAQGEGNERPN